MKNRIFLIFFIFLNLSISSIVTANEEFVFNITELEVKDNGNIIIGLKRGEINTNNNLIIIADKFIYEKKKNKLTATGNIKINDLVNNITLFSNKVVYKKNENEILSEGPTEAYIDSKYELFTTDIYYLRNKNELKSSQSTTIIDKDSNIYNFNKFNFLIFDELLKAENIEILMKSNSNNEDYDKLKFANGFFNFKNRSFNAKDTRIDLKKNIFNNSENDPRLLGVSSSKKGEITTINNGIFTSCKISDNCTPWSLKSKKIQHDADKKQIIYEHAVLNIYDYPVFYFPKFFHPDPSVKRQQGFLQPSFNSSQILGSSIKLPYFFPVSDNKDFTIKPTFFNNDMLMIQNEYRQKNENSYWETDFAITKGYKSKTDYKKKNLSHFFSKFEVNLNLDNFYVSSLNFNLERVSNDTYLKIFDQNINDTSLKPSTPDNLISELNINLANDFYSIKSGIIMNENLQELNNDRYQFVLPYYELNTKNFNSENGYLQFSSLGSSTLQNTNNIKSLIVNDLKFYSNDIISNYGIKNNLNYIVKNINTLGKQDDVYKSSPQVELMSLFEYRASLPLVRDSYTHTNLLIPEISFRFNPTDMKNYTNEDRTVDINNLFEMNRLGFNDSLEAGKSLTLGTKYRRDNLEKINEFFEFNIAKVIRDKYEKDIPIKSLINKKSSDNFGSIKYNKNNFNVEYDFITNNYLSEFSYNSIKTNLVYKNLSTTFNFVEQNGTIGDNSFLENESIIELDGFNKIKYKTRVNKKINLTEYHDLIYEYQNDCLTAGISYKKTYYEDRDLKPSEDLFFTITLFPLTAYDQQLSNLLN